MSVVVMINAVSREDLTIKDKSVGAVSRLADFGWQVDWRSQLMGQPTCRLESAKSTPPMGMRGTR